MLIFQRQIGMSRGGRTQVGDLTLNPDIEEGVLEDDFDPLAHLTDGEDGTFKKRGRLPAPSRAPMVE